MIDEGEVAMRSCTKANFIYTRMFTLMKDRSWVDFAW